MKTTEVFQAKVGGKSAALCILDSDIDTLDNDIDTLDNDIEILANSLKERLFTTVEGSLWRQRMKFQPWVTNEVLDLCEQREQMKHKYTSTEAGLEHRKVNREVGRKMKAAKEVWIEEPWKSIERGLMLGTKRLSLRLVRANSLSQQSSKAAAETF